MSDKLLQVLLEYIDARIDQKIAEALEQPAKTEDVAVRLRKLKWEYWKSQPGRLIG